MGIAILLVMAAGVGLMLSRKLPTALALLLLAVAIAFMGGAPVMGDNSVAETVLEEGGVLLADTMVAIILGSWLGTIMDRTGIAATLVRKTVELGGDRPWLVAVGVFVVALLVGTVTGSAPAAMLVGTIGIPAMVAIGIPGVTAAGSIVIGLSAGTPFELVSWQYLSDTVGVSVEQVRAFQLRFFPIVVAIGLAYVLIECRRRGTVRTWGVDPWDSPSRCLPQPRFSLSHPSGVSDWPNAFHEASPRRSPFRPRRRLCPHRSSCCFPVR
jgi:TRAP-type transport system large permease protein